MDKRNLKRNFQLSKNVVDLVMIDKRHLKRNFEELRSIRKTVRTSTWRAGRRRDRPLHPDPVSVPEPIRRPRPEQRGEELSQTRWRPSFESFCVWKSKIKITKFQSFLVLKKQGFPTCQLHSPSYVLNLKWQ